MMLFTSSSNSVAKLKAATDTLGWWPVAAPAPKIVAGAGEIQKVRLLEGDVKSKMIFDDDAVQMVKLMLKGAGVEATQRSGALFAALVLIPDLDCVGSFHWD